MYSTGNTNLRVQRTLDFLSPPNSNPVSPRECRDESLIGVGLLFVIHANSGKVFVHSIVPDTPAERSGCINIGDALVSIDARPITNNTSLAELRSRVLGPYSSTVTLGFSRSMFEDESISSSSYQFSVILTRESSQTSVSDRYKEARSTERAFASNMSGNGASKITESSAELQPHPPPARALNQLLPAKGSMSSTSPKQRFSVVGKKPLEDKSLGGALEFPGQHNVSRAITSEQLNLTAANRFFAAKPLHQLQETFSQQPNQVPSNMASMQIFDHFSDSMRDAAISAAINAEELLSIQRLSIEAQAMDSWLQAKASKLLIIQFFLEANKFLQSGSCYGGCRHAERGEANF